MADIEGLDKVVSRLDELSNPEKIEKSLEKACLVVERAAKEKAPHNTGALRRSITSKVEGDEGVVFTPLEYAPYIEYGTGLFAENGGRMDVPWNYQDDSGEWHTTSGMKPQPFLHPALAENRQQILEIFKEGLTK